MGARLLALIIKEFLALFRDKKSRMAVIVPPILQLLVFGYAATFDLEDAKLAILNEDGGVFSRDLAARFERSPGFKIVGYLRSTAEIAPLIDRRGALLVLHIGEQCAQEALGGDGCPLQVLIDGRNSNTAMLALNYVRTIVTDFNEERAEVNGTSLPARLNIRAWFNPNLESRWFIVPGIVALLAMIVTLVVTSLSVAREREAGTFDQLLVTPLHPWEILIGKAMPGLIVGVGEASLIIAVTVFWFEVPLVGKLSVLYPALIIYVLSIIGVGLMISSFSATLQQALLGSFLFIVPAVILSGFSTPIANMPPFMQTLTYLDPMRYFLSIVRRVFLEGAGLEYFIHDLWPMSLIALITLSLATWLFRHRMY
ncbi:ABC-2 type transporter [Desulfobulbus propionicus DSM 2032]|uniref:ABC-2 type transporter n=1 Tax=Desulfobulbus propionicus (strain ATCC 33891 / DSM 2032 / VKM B-1956 / 1pr3) TaxID=577650 RepID=A0A7U3YLL5_DESPD|nr:ABC transporter permease [Desulfobulbus propionicus]ADW17635.1 ABC-2 type transporter [Desulfobulbus propionicus DSM 2032]